MHSVFRIGMVASAVLIFWAVLRWLILPDDPQALSDLAAWGESFGGLSALISAAGFLAVVWSIQRQQGDQHRQRFHGQYIELLKLFREVRSDVVFSHSDTYMAANPTKIVTGESVKAFRTAWREVDFYIEENDNKDQVRDWYVEKVHKRYESNLGPYFRLVYTILKMIQSDSVLSEIEKVKYGNLLRSQLTSFELVIHGLNGLAPFSKDFPLLIAEFKLLKYLPEGGKRRRLLERFYPAEAFQGRD